MNTAIVTTPAVHVVSATKRPARRPRKNAPHQAANRPTTKARPVGPDRRYVLTRAELDELIALVDDLPGAADETLLLEAFDAVYQPVEFDETYRSLVRAGTHAAFRLAADERYELRALVQYDGYRLTPKYRTALSRLLHEARPTSGS